MKIFDEIDRMKRNLLSVSDQYSKEYVCGYIDALNDIENKIKNRVSIKTE